MKETMEAKQTEVAIQGAAKETLSDRLRSLIGNRSARAAAQEWGLSFSTLNNYLNRGTEPSFGVAARIAEHEGVSIEWLAFGGELNSKTNSKTTSEEVVNSIPPSTDILDPARYAWLMVYESLDKEEVEALLRLIHKRGVDGILNAKAAEDIAAQDFLQLSEADQQRVLRLAKQLREGVTEDDQENELTHPTHKQAG